MAGYREQNNENKDRRTYRESGGDSGRRREERTSRYGSSSDDDDDDIFAEGSFTYSSSRSSSRRKNRDTESGEREYEDSGNRSEDRARKRQPREKKGGIWSRENRREKTRNQNRYQEDRGAEPVYRADDVDDAEDVDAILDAMDAMTSPSAPEVQDYGKDLDRSRFDDYNATGGDYNSTNSAFDYSDDDDESDAFAEGEGYSGRNDQQSEGTGPAKKSLFKRRKAEREEREDSRRDNIIHVGGDAELREENLRRAKNRQNLRAKIFVILLVAVIIAVAAYFVYTSIREFRGYKTLASTNTRYEANADYTEFGGNLLKITLEGVSYIDPNGEVVWTAGADLKVPIFATRGDWAVVADKGGNGVHVFNTEGQVSSLTMPYKVLDCDIATQGAFVVVLESENTNFVNMYDKNGTPIYEIQTSIDKSGYPLDISLSDDGQKLFTSYFFMEGIETKNNLTAYNFGSVGQNANADRIVGGFSLEGQLVTRVQFLTNNLVAAFADTEIILYDMKETPSERCRIQYQQAQIQSIFFSKGYLGTIEKSSGGEESTNYLMRVYDLSGDETFHYAFNMAYDNIHAGEDEIILTGGNQCCIITRKGRVKFRYAFDTLVRNVIPTSASNEYIVTFEGRTEKIGLKMEDE
jgi:hypothetical protein